MKKLLVLLMIGTMTLTSLVGCGKEKENNTDNTFEKIEVSGEYNGASESETIENTDNSSETVNESTEVIPEPTVKPEVKPEEQEAIIEILDEAFEAEESYKYSMMIDIEYNISAEELDLSNAEFKDAFKDSMIKVTSVTETTVDNENNCSFTNGSITSLILGTEATSDISYYVTEDGENYISYLYDNITNTWIKNTSSVEYTDIYSYYKNSEDFYISKESDTECTIEGIIYYVDLAYNVGNVAGDIGIDYDVEIPVTYLIDKTNNRVKSITFSLDDVNAELAETGTKVDISVEILSVGEFDVEIPEDVLAKAVDWSEAPAYPEDIPEAMVNQTIPTP